MAEAMRAMRPSVNQEVNHLLTQQAYVVEQDWFGHGVDLMFCRNG